MSRPLKKKLLIILLMAVGTLIAVRSARVSSVTAQSSVPAYIWIEAESGSITPPMQIADDANASGGKYIASALGNDSTPGPPANGVATYKFKVKSPGTYKVWGRVITPAATGDSFWVRMDKAAWVKWENIPPGASWHWDDVHNADNAGAAITLNLSAKKHTLKVAYRESGARLDRLLITNDLSFVPPEKEGCAGEGTSALWSDFVEATGAGREPILPDFSYAGYQYSERPIPTVTGPVFNVTDYGAVANDEGYDDAAIQSAIDSAAKAGGGVVLFPAGRFLVSPNTNPNEYIRITASRIVLRGSGSSDGGTEILMDHMKPGGAMFKVFPASSSSTVLATITADAQRETFWVQVENASSLRVGDRVVIRYQSPAYNSIYWQGLPLDAAWSRVHDDGPNFHEVHSIAEIQGNRVRFNEPLHFTIKMNSAPFTVRSISLLEEVGVEDIRFTGKWDTYPEEFVHHKDAIHDSGWSIWSISRVANGWMRRCEIKHVNQGIHTDAAVAFTFDRILFTGKKGHTSISTRRGYGTLVKDSEDLAAHHHGPGFGYQGVGTVYLRHKMQVGQRIDSHGGNPYASLIDQTTGGVLDGNGGPHENYPHHSFYFVFWNFAHRASGSKNYDFWNVERRLSAIFARPIFAGFTSTSRVTFQDEATEVMRNESLGTPVTPGSLFEAQLALRLCRKMNQ